MQQVLTDKDPDLQKQAFPAMAQGPDGGVYKGQGIDEKFSIIDQRQHRELLMQLGLNNGWSFSNVGNTYTPIFTIADDFIFTEG